MRQAKPLPVVLLVGLSSVALAGPAVTLTLESPSDGQTVAAGSRIGWTIRVATSRGDNAGLALVCVNLVQDDTNPAFLDIPPGDLASLDATMDDFSRPLGISNPGEDGAATGYVGVQRGVAGRMDLVQIGGGQNTFGVAGPAGMGQDILVETGVGQGAEPQLVLCGSFAAPSTAGMYRFRLRDPLANVLATVSGPPQSSSVMAATVDVGSASFSFTVQASLPICPGDCDCDRRVTFDDINYFVAALVGHGAGWAGYYGREHDGQVPPCNYANCDINDDGQVDFDDIDPFVALLASSPACP